MLRCPAFGLGISRVISLTPLTARGESGALAVHARAQFKNCQIYRLYRGNSELSQVFGHGIHALHAGGIVVGPQQHITPDQCREIRLLPGVRPIRPAGSHVLRQQFGAGIGCFLTLTQHYWRRWAFSQLIKIQQRTWFR
ncbi:hypothetical protein D3C80_1028890 [compost metagenome]